MPEKNPMITPAMVRKAEWLSTTEKAKVLSIIDGGMTVLEYIETDRRTARNIWADVIEPEWLGEETCFRIAVESARWLLRRERELQGMADTSASLFYALALAEAPDATSDILVEAHGWIAEVAFGTVSYRFSCCGVAVLYVLRDRIARSGTAAPVIEGFSDFDLRETAWAVADAIDSWAYDDGRWGIGNVERVLRQSLGVVRSVLRGDCQVGSIPLAADAEAASPVEAA